MDVIGQDSSSESPVSDESESSPVEHVSAESSDVPAQDSGGNGEERHGKRRSGYERAKRQRIFWEEKSKSLEQRTSQLEQQLEAVRAQSLRERQEAQKPKRGYTLEELQGYTEQWQEDLETLTQEPYPTDEQRKQISELKSLLRKAGKETQKMQAEQMAERQLVELPQAGTPRHAEIWHQCEAELRQADPEFQKPGSRLDKHLRDIFQSADGNHYRSHPRGIYAAYSEAQKRILKEDVQKLKEENQKLRSLTSIGGGISARPGLNGNTKPFEKMTSAEMRKHLESTPRLPFDSMPLM